MMINKKKGTNINKYHILFDIHINIIKKGANSMEKETTPSQSESMIMEDR